MIRKLMASTAIAALLTTGALAQSQPTTETQAQTNVDVKTQQGSNEALASDWMGKTVYSSAAQDAKEIGDINDLLLDEKGDVTAAIVGVGGFLGIGEHTVAIPYDQFEVTQDQNGDPRLVLNTTEEALKNAPEFERQEGQRTFADMRENGGNNAENTSMAANDSAKQDADKMTDSKMADGQKAMPANVAFVEYSQDQNRVSEWMGREVYSSTATPASEQMNSTTTMAKDNATEGTTQNGATTGQQASGTATNAEVAADTQQSVGEVDDVILSDAGQVESIVIDVGGFLGVGEKAVAIPYDQIELTRVPDEDEPRLTIAMTRQQLEQAQPFDASAYRPDNLASTEQATGAENTGGTDMAMTGEKKPATQTGDMSDQKAEGTQMATSEQNGAMKDGSATMRTASAKANGTSADNLLGSTVYGSNDESVGEIGDVIVSQKGDVEAVIIDVGGFLGIGEKPVAVEYDTLNVQKNTDGETRYSISATEDQLDKAPAYEETQ
ncbi:PRC-barrel domain-containing protein [Afifella sp. IM 167]|uniref:PRC-barrel domain-containing protein n=1 Tax=Afifella sp. IM 167 TaxID=2033586 RepID=UPI001CCC8018|nr:PRC-barrel domain-containing protein [Afifella sp. IM 167]MBZ8134639.1 hypothetical protein [Afifella sp. IM 167]